MSRKNKTLRAFLHQTQNPTVEQAWEVAWKHAQKTFHARSMQDMGEKLAATQAEVGALRAEVVELRNRRADAIHECALANIRAELMAEALEQCITSMLDRGYRADAVVIRAARAAIRTMQEDKL